MHRRRTDGKSRSTAAEAAEGRRARAPCSRASASVTATARCGEWL